MLLKDFVTATLKDISAALHESQAGDYVFEIDTKDGKGIQFDVMVSAEEKKQIKGEGHIGLRVLTKLQVGAGQVKTQGRTNRIQFTVQIRKRRDGTLVSKGVTVQS